MTFAATLKSRVRLCVLVVVSVGLLVTPAGAEQASLGTVVAWGCGSGVGFGQCTVPIATVSGVTAIAAADYDSLALKQDGGVVAWGCRSSDSGQCTVPAAAASGVTAIAAGTYHSLALKANGSVVAWGCGNNFGQCAVPAAAASGVTAVAAGRHHSLALKADGSVLAWGCLVDYGQCTVPAAASGVTAIAAGASHSLVLKQDGSVAAWGCTGPSFVNAGQCVVPAAAASAVTAVAAGQYHSLALKQDGSVVAWGCSGGFSWGQCTVPPAAASGVKAIAAGALFSVAVKEDGSVLVWGDCGQGQCTVPAAASGIAAVAAGSSHVLALRAAGDARADLSLVKAVSPGPVQVGDTVTYDFTVANAGPQSAEHVLLHDALPLGLTSAGFGTITGGASCSFGAARRTIDCSWASLASGTTVQVQIFMTVNQPGQLVNTATVRSDTIDPVSTNNSSTASVQANLSRTLGLVAAWGCSVDADRAQCNVPSGLSGVTAIAAGTASHGLALKGDGTVVAWGCGLFATFGQCSVPDGLSGVTAVAAGEAHSLALKSDGTVVAWGCGSGYGPAPCNVPVGLSGVTAIASGQIHNLALKSDGTVVAWGCVGASDHGQCSVPGGLADVTSIAAGFAHSVALKSDGTVVAWGCSGIDLGQCSVPGGLSGVTAIATGGYCSLALKSNGTVVAWGIGSPGAECKVPFGLSGVAAIAVGSFHSLALKHDGTVVAWGCGGGFDFGQCTVLSGLRGVTAVAAGYSHSLALVGRTTPDAPAGVSATAGDGQATVNWTAPAFDGGSAVTGYEVTRYAGGTPQGTTSVAVVTQLTATGLANGTTYTFKVAAKNALGAGPQSSESNAATPAAPKFTLTVTKFGAGSGTVTSDVGGVDCGATCTATLDAGTTIALTATAAAGSSFAGWIGACSGTGACTLTMDQNRAATAVFTLPSGTPKTLSVGRAGNGGGSVLLFYAGGATDCFGACTRDFAYGSSVTLSATAAAGSTFAGWTGDCSGTGACKLTMDQNRSATATFTLVSIAPSPQTLTVAKAGTGTGTVTSSPAGIDCGSTCTRDFDHGTQVTLTATAGPGSTFAGWTGACSGAGACAMALDDARSATATFNQVQSPPKTVRCVVPNVKGKSLATAKARIAAAHCRTGKVTRAKSRSVATGRVVSQRPKAGTKLASGSKVSLVVSRGRR